MLEKFNSLKDQGLELEEFTLRVGDRSFTAVIASPRADRLHPDPVLLLSVGGQDTHLIPPNDQPARVFWEHGHRVVSFGIASETEPENALRIKSQGPDAKFNVAIEILRDNFVTGPDPFVNFIQEARAVVKYCLDRNWARPRRIVVTGISRFGYLAFRLMAADEQFRVGGGFAPVTDWRVLAEFSEIKHQARVEDLCLSKFVGGLAGKKIFLAVGSHDERVSTLSCCKFFLELNTENRKCGLDNSWIDFLCTSDPHHTCSDQWYRYGTELLLNWAISNT